jgi:hypothetical protein
VAAHVLWSAKLHLDHNKIKQFDAKLLRTNAGGLMFEVMPRFIPTELEKSCIKN